MSQTLAKALRIAATLALWGVGGYVLNKYEFFTAFGAIDNFVGMLPVAFVLIAVICSTVLVWMGHSKELLPISVTLAVFVVLSVVLFPTALRGDWWVNMLTPDAPEAAPDMSIYTPFTGAQTARLDEEATLRLTTDLPVLDGATALYPVYAAFAEAVYDEDAFSQDDVLCTNTHNAYEAVIAGERDVVFMAGASKQQAADAREAGADLRFTPIGREAFVFLVGRSNPIDNITYQQIRNIYSGKTADWGTLGWREGGKMIVFQRPEGSGSQTGLETIMDGFPIQAPQPLPDASLLGTNSLMRQVSVEWHGVQPALGYSYRFFATTMYANPDAKLLKVNGVEPTMENIRSGAYPFVVDFYAVTNGEPEGNAKRLIDWILSPQGQELIEKTGYTPVE